MMQCRGVRGATTASANTRAAILSATRELLVLLLERNGVAVDEIASAFFTVSDDLDAEYPALAARELGWHDVALLCAREIAVPGGLVRCVRVLLHVNTERAPTEIRHVYLREAASLRPSRADPGDTPDRHEPPEGEIGAEPDAPTVLLSEGDREGGRR